jgi:2-oxoisovalerate dehydrogenase E1 component beta subunit
MPTMNMIQSIRSALEVMLERDPNVCVFGEDVGYFGGVFRATQGLQHRFGPQRVFDTPLAEGGIVAIAIGMGINGLRPVPEIQFSDYMYPAFDQISNELAKLRYRSGGEWTAPLTIRAPSGGGIRGGLYHSQSPEAYYTHTPGLCVVMPSNPHDAKGLLISSIESDDPVVFFEPKRLYRVRTTAIPIMCCHGVTSRKLTCPRNTIALRSGRHPSCVQVTKLPLLLGGRWCM